MNRTATASAAFALAACVTASTAAVVMQKTYAAAPEMQLEEGKDYHATLKTNMGDIKLDLFEKDAPIHVNNFVFLANDDFYDGVIFHRVINNFMIQGGDPEGTGMGGPGYTIPDEVANNPNKHEPFTLSMAKTAAPNTGGSQFFITETATPHLNGVHTVFGRVVEGEDVVEKISDVDVRRGSNRPLEDVVIEDVVIEMK
jgi:cyclophilin family peptidyl-prolyl cis-trans isomerase